MVGRVAFADVGQLRLGDGADRARVHAVDREAQDPPQERVLDLRQLLLQREEAVLAHGGGVADDRLDQLPRVLLRRHHRDHHELRQRDDELGRRGEEQRAERPAEDDDHRRAEEEGAHLAALEQERAENGAAAEQQPGDGSNFQRLLHDSPAPGLRTEGLTRFSAAAPRPLAHKICSPLPVQGRKTPRARRATGRGGLAVDRKVATWSSGRANPAPCRARGCCSAA